MNKLLSLLLIGLFFVSAHATVDSTPLTKSENDFVEVSDSVNSSFTNVEKKVRAAAVKVVRFNGGHGSGSLIDYKGLPLVITAQHVTSDAIGTLYYIQSGSESLLGVLIYSDAINDIAVLYMPTEFTNAAPMKYSPLEDISKVGDQIIYSAYPSSHDLLSFRGRVAGYENLQGRGTQIILHTYGWFGCSGSVVYDHKGNIVGVLWGVDLEHYPSTQAIEDIIWVSPIRNLNMDIALKVICEAGVEDSKACR